VNRNDIIILCITYNTRYFILFLYKRNSNFIIISISLVLFVHIFYRCHLTGPYRFISCSSSNTIFYLLTIIIVQTNETIMKRRIFYRYLLLLGMCVRKRYMTSSKNGTQLSVMSTQLYAYNISIINKYIRSKNMVSMLKYNYYTHS